MLNTLTLEEIQQMNPNLDLEKFDESVSLRETLRMNGHRGREEKASSGRYGVRARFDDRAQNESRMVKLRK